MQTKYPQTKRESNKIKIPQFKNEKNINWILINRLKEYHT